MHATEYVLYVPDVYTVGSRWTKTRHKPLDPLHPWQARFLCRDSDYFWDSVDSRRGPCGVVHIRLNFLMVVSYVQAQIDGPAYTTACIGAMLGNCCVFFNNIITSRIKCITYIPVSVYLYSCISFTVLTVIGWSTVWKHCTVYSVHCTVYLSQFVIICASYNFSVGDVSCTFLVWVQKVNSATP